MNAETVRKQLLSLGSPEKAEHSKYFFKTGKGEYGEGDRFIGCTVPEIRGVAAKNLQLPFGELQRLLDDEFHECRLCALVILTRQFEKAGDTQRKRIFEFYLNNTHAVNNWDLVDLSCYKIVGEWLLNKNRDILYQLMKSEKLWEQRIAVVSTLTFIRRNDFADILKISESLLDHKHDLIHKACGWMLREVGKREEVALTGFLDRYHREKPRTMLRYAIERLSKAQKQKYMTK